jgi:osmotically-inducible protein OsmY
MLIGSEKIEKDVLERLQSDNRLEGSEIGVSVSNSDAVLSGFVPTYRARRVAEMDASAVPGVKKLINNLSIRYGEEIADEELSKRIRAMLDWSGDLDASMISISVQKGEVNLQGAVKSNWEKLHAEDIASNASGVKAIENRLVITPLKKYDDKMIAENIMRALDKNLHIDPNMVKVYVKVKSGRVILSGNAPTWAAHEAILNIAFFTPGVIDVADDLTIGMI